MKTNTYSIHLFCLLLCLGSFVTLSAQDIHFSQYEAAPLSLNPAMTGDFEGDWRAATTYRSQWQPLSTAFATNVVSFDKQFKFPAGTFSGGLLYFNDRSGIVRINTNKVYLSTAFGKKFGNNKLQLGYQIGFVSKKVDINALSFPNQFNNETGGFDNQLENIEPNMNGSTGYLDMNVGILWRAKMGKIEPKLGIALFHLNSPKESFLENTDEKLTPRQQYNVGIRYHLNDKISIAPDAMLNVHSKASELLLGGDITYAFNWNPLGVQAVFAGANLRMGLGTNQDAVIGVMGMEIKNFRVGVSYDVNVSGLQTATNQRGGFEISLIYIGRTNPPDKIQIPCDRY